MNPLPQTEADAAAERRALTALAGLSTAARLAFSAAADVQTAGNAAWLQALLSPVAALPALAAFCYASGRPVPRAARRGVCALFFFLFVAEFSSWLYALGECVAYTTFSDLPTLALLVPAACVCAYAASLGKGACGGLGQVQLAVVPWCFALSALWQARSLRPVYLTPFLGGGARAIAVGALLCAGTGASLPAGLWVFWREDGGLAAGEGRRAARALPLAALSAAAVLLLYGMLAPNFTGSPRTPTRATEQLLMGGGASTSVQFLLMLVWYSALTLGCVYSCTAAAHSLRGALERLSLRACSWLTTAPCLALVPIWMRFGNTRERLLRWWLVLFTAGMGAAAVSAWIAERRKRRGA